VNTLRFSLLCQKGSGKMVGELGTYWGCRQNGGACPVQETGTVTEP
jgi:hypothetical protein